MATTTSERVAERPEEAPAAPVSPGRGRVDAIDATRGIAIISAVPVAFAFLNGWGIHAEWYGLARVDLVFPVFLAVFGTGLAIATKKGVSWSRVARRTVGLIAVGVFFNATTARESDPALWRFTSVLAAFALSGLVVVLVLDRTRRPWVLAGLAAGVLVAHGLAQRLYASAACGTDLPQPDCTLTVAVDHALLGLHTYRNATVGYDPEGLAVLPGVVGVVLLGAMIGVLHERWGSDGRMLALGGVLAAAAVPAAVLLPLNKRLWSPPVVLLGAAVTALLIVLCGQLLFRRAPVAPVRVVQRVLGTPLVAAGRNSLLLYVGSFLVPPVLAVVVVGGESLRERADRLADPFGDPASVIAVVTTVLWVLLALVLHRRRWYVRV